MTKPKKRYKSSMELLAPAGSFEAFDAALEEGADAVYIGAPKLNARALSRDFTYPEIDILAREAHRKDVKLYIAMNSLVKESEIRTAIEGLSILDEIGPDALIVQDLGLARLAMKYFPTLSLHASTLMSVHNSLAVRKMTELGFKRIVLPRELTLKEIKEVHERTGAELEVFVHGAMCFSYSGLCLFSSMFGGKSSLRGQCVQPCRRRYAWQRKKGFVKKGKLTEKDGGYLFSMNDLSGIDLLPQLQDAGVSCLKIEGRLKSAEYVRKVVRAYRLLLDTLDEPGNQKEKIKTAHRYLDEAMGRRRSNGFFVSDKPQDAVTPSLSGNIGLPAGKVLKLEDISGRGSGKQMILAVELVRDIQVGDRLRLHDERSGERKGFTLRTMKVGSRPIQKAKGGQKVQIFFQGKGLKSSKGVFKGKLFKIDVGFENKGKQKGKEYYTTRKRRSLEPDERRINRIIKECHILEPKTTGHNLQRKSGRKLPIWVRISSLRDRQYRLPVVPEKYIVPINKENLELLQKAPAKLRIFDQELIWSLPPVIEEVRLPWYAKTIGGLAAEGFVAYQLGHISQVGFFDDLVAHGDGFKFFGQYTCNILNSASLELFNDYRFSGVLFSLETDEENLDLALNHFYSMTSQSRKQEFRPAVGMYVFGRPPLFTARLNDSSYRYGKRVVSPRGEVFVLDHQDGITTVSAVPPFSLLHVRQELAQYGIDYLVVDLSVGNIKRNVTEFDALMRRRRKDVPVMSGNFSTGLL